ncbi:MAG TPA: hypothetical protein VJP59_07945 [Gemmatimonadota bacterium]|nr:hypothetical protein [Gemmatimonadota bacterium]
MNAAELTRALEDQQIRMEVLERRYLQAQADRDELIVSALAAGVRQADIARALRLSPGRVGQLVTRLRMKQREAI